MEHIQHELFWKTVNTVILIAILYWLLKKPVSKFISDGINAVVSRFERAKQEKEEVLRLLKEAERKSEEAKAEAERILQYSKELAAKEREQIIAEAKQTAERIIRMADEEIEKEVYKAKEELKKFAARKAVEIAEAKLKAAANPEINKRLIESTLQKL
ncbi:ATP synthase F0 subunit B [Phorcysia thermohydrogeniphila]|uniref:ATP synthase subunit b n=1 Tax=Phorcysia thermohydrogeniphila TaxID=936138 RepID=A0A4R1G735_9BACT|nr:ATP synthase F0 subunit B [Phorcysia thermohydrogeniphila]TCK03857.1 F-type H+-transporting ATPase subunit b [Phorcysia thermohydrogeniphila]